MSTPLIHDMLHMVRNGECSIEQAETWINERIEAVEVDLRDMFAMEALPGLLKGSTWADVRDGSGECAAAAYHVADAMLEARNA